MLWFYPPHVAFVVCHCVARVTAPRVFYRKLCSSICYCQSIGQVCKTCAPCFFS
nr:MAG TPA: hypothetical protein [Caudoviricetes sp.]